MKIFISCVLLIFFTSSINASGINVYGFGMYDIICDTKDSPTTDFRYERRLNNSLLDIGPKEDNFFFLKPFVGFEYTGRNASYLLTGIYLEDNIGQLFKGEKNKILFTPSFGVGYYEKGSGKDLGNTLQFRTTLELSYELKNNNRIGFSFGHISNANTSGKNPGVEVISLSYQIPY